MTHRRQNFMGGAAILAGAVAVTKLLGALYKIPLGNLLDREGMAHFYAAYNIYSLLLVLSTAGLPVALSRICLTNLSVFFNPASVYTCSGRTNFCAQCISHISDYIKAFCGTNTTTTGNNQFCFCQVNGFLVGLNCFNDFNVHVCCCEIYLEFNQFAFSCFVLCDHFHNAGTYG